MQLELGLNILTLGLILIAVLLVYFFSILTMNIYINLTAKSASLMNVFSFLLGITVISVIYSLHTLTLIVFALTIIFLVYAIIKGRKKRKKANNSNTSAQAIGNINSK